VSDDPVTVVHNRLLWWGLFDSTDVVELGRLRLNTGYWMSHRDAAGYTFWDANVIDGVFYLLSIALPPYACGRGLGSALYEILTEIAADLGCREIRQTPSGWTHNGESRLDYLLRRGWEQDGRECFRRLGVNVAEAGA